MYRKFAGGGIFFIPLCKVLTNKNIVMKRLVVSLVAAVSLMACSQQPLKDYYEIEGYITGVEDGAVFTLFRETGEPAPGIDHDTLQNGRFYFRVKPEQTKEHLTVLCWQDDYPSMPVHLWAEAGDCVRITGDDKLVYTWRVDGPASENDSWQGYVRSAEELYDKLQRVMIEEGQLYLSDEDPALVQVRYDSLGRVQQEIMVDIHGHIIDHMKHQKMDAVGLIHLMEIAAMCNYMEDYPYREAAREVFDSLDKEWLSRPEVEQIRVHLYPVEKAVCGEHMIDGQMYDMSGASHTLGELHGKYILVDFWSSGCAPCVMAMPEMGAIAEQYKDCLEVVSITTDGDKPWREASEQHPITWHNWSDGKRGTGIYAHYEQSGVPNYVLISPEGIIIDQWVGYGSGSLKLKMAEHLK